MGQMYNDTPRYDYDLEDAHECEDCGADTASWQTDNRAWLCATCREAREAEASCASR